MVISFHSETFGPVLNKDRVSKESVIGMIKAPTNIAIPANTLSIVLKKSRPCLIESACSAAASWAFMTFKFSESKFVISVLRTSSSYYFGSSIWN